jgi:hypothetical protein
VRVPVAPQHTSSWQIRSEQNEEYERSEEIARQTAAQVAERKQVEARRKEDVRRAIELAAEQIPPEPASGVAIQFVLPSGGKIVRRFSPDQPADHLFALIAAKPEFFDEAGEPRRFELRFSQVLEKGKTLAEQGITGRSQIRVALLD